MQSDIGSKTRSSLIWNTSLKVVAQLYKFVTSIIIARILDPRDFGIMGIVTMVVFYANSITTFGFNASLIQRKEIDERHINSVFSVNAIIAILLTSTIALFSRPIAGFFHAPELANVLLIVSPVFILMNYFSLPISLMKREVNFKLVALIDFFCGLFQTIVTLTLALLGFKYWALVFGLITSYAIGALYVLLLKKERRPRFRYDHSAMKDIFSFGIWNFIRAQTFHINENADTFIVGRFLGPVSLGFYDKAFSTVASLRQNFTTQINAVMFSSFSRLQSEPGDKIKKYLKKSLTLSSLITFPICTGLFALGEPFVMVLLGNKWVPMVTPLKILAMAFIFNSMNGLMSSLNVGMGNYTKQAVREFGCNVLLVLLCLLLVKNGIEFVALGVLLTYATMFIATFHLTKTTIGINLLEAFEGILPATMASVTMVFMILISERVFFTDRNILNLVLLVGIGGVSYLLMVFLPTYAVLEDVRKPVIVYIKNVCNKFFALSSG